MIHGEQDAVDRTPTDWTKMHALALALALHSGLADAHTIAHRLAAAAFGDRGTRAATVCAVRG